nr:LITAF-like zinc ribbon domain-containing protein [Streptomyces harenosi]
MDGRKHVCPSCGQQVETVVRRHKTLGAWVPVWAPGPCRNPGCEAHPAQTPESARAPRGTHTARGTTAAPRGASPRTTEPPGGLRDGS